MSKYHFSPSSPDCFSLCCCEQEAQKLFSTFKKTIEASDLALYKKDEATADKLIQQANSVYSSWLDVVGITV